MTPANPILAEMLATRHVTMPDGSTIPLADEISVAEGELLQRLIRAQRPQVTLEVGCAYGVSALYICEALAYVGGRKHIVIDPDQKTDWRAAGLHAIERAGFTSLVEFHGQSSHLVLPALEAAGQRIGLALIDGFHTFDYTMVDFFFIDRLLETNGSVVLDDTTFPAIRKVARYIATHRKYEPIPADAATPMPRKQHDPLQAAPSRGRLQRFARRFISAEILRPDSALGLPQANFIAFRKTAEDVRGNGTGGTRRWDQHHDF